MTRSRTRRPESQTSARVARRPAPPARRAGSVALGDSGIFLKATSSQQRRLQHAVDTIHLAAARSVSGGLDADPQATFAAATRGSAIEVPHRAEMEAAFGQDFSTVQAHVGQAGPMGALGAHAAASGDVVAFSSTTPDRRLVAHELTHVVQARRAGGRGIAGKGGVSDPSSAAEREADAVADRVVAGERVVVGAAPAAPLQRQGDDKPKPRLEGKRTLKMDPTLADLPGQTVPPPRYVVPADKRSFLSKAWTDQLIKELIAKGIEEGAAKEIHTRILDSMAAMTQAWIDGQYGGKALPPEISADTEALLQGELQRYYETLRADEAKAEPTGEAATQPAPEPAEDAEPKKPNDSASGDALSALKDSFKSAIEQTDFYTKLESEAKAFLASNWELTVGPAALLLLGTAGELAGGNPQPMVAAAEVVLPLVSYSFPLGDWKVRLKTDEATAAEGDSATVSFQFDLFNDVGPTGKAQAGWAITGKAAIDVPITEGGLGTPSKGPWSLNVKYRW